MKRLIKLYHFLGGYIFAILLLGLIAIFVIAGTFIESSSQSHRYAAQFTYGHPAFALILWLLFVNILFAALRRWPFQRKHIPFLLTHLGLLLLLSGCLLKHYFGTQGSMAIIEGSGTDRLLIPDSYAVYIEKKNNADPAKNHSVLYPLKKTLLGGFNTTSQGIGAERDFFKELTVHVEKMWPHVEEGISPWIDDQLLKIAGYPPIPVSTDGSHSIASVLLLQPGIPWQIAAAKVENVEKAAKQVWIRETVLHLTHPRFLHKEIPLNELMQHSIVWHELVISGSLSFAWEPSKDFEPALELAIQNKHTSSRQTIRIELAGPKKLLNQIGRENLGVEADLAGRPTVAFLQDAQDNVSIFCYGPHGEVSCDNFPNKIPDKILVYDDGFGGYTIPWKFPYPLYLADRKDLSLASLYSLKQQLDQAAAADATLAPPLAALSHACQTSQVNFASSCIEFLHLWNKDGHWLYQTTAELPKNLQKAFADFPWKSIPRRDYSASVWIASIVNEIEQELDQGKDLLAILEERRWPLTEAIKRSMEADIEKNGRSKALAALSQQIYTVADQLPYQLPQTQGEKTPNIFSAWLRLYSLDLASIYKPADEAALHNYLQDSLLAENEKNNFFFPPRTAKHKEQIKAALSTPLETLETPLIVKFIPMPPSTKLEDNKPLAVIALSDSLRTERMTLAYDKQGTGMKWPGLANQYLVRFQPLTQEIPYRVRLRAARQICYPGTAQPYSYECEVLITDKATGGAVEKTISMNTVHETWDGYRFYLAGMSPPDEGSVKRIQIIVNHDPGKYIATYPGACVLSLGIFLLFWMRPYGQIV